MMKVPTHARRRNSPAQSFLPLREEPQRRRCDDAPHAAQNAPAEPARTPEALRALGHQPEPVLRAIRRKCLDCSGGSHAEVADCVVRQCDLYPFRLGKNPWRPPVSAAQRQASRRNAATLANRENHGIQRDGWAAAWREPR